MKSHSPGPEGLYGEVPKTIACAPGQNPNWVRSTARNISRLLFLATAVITMLSLSSPLANASSFPSALVIAKYAVATATHDEPAHVVTAADVNNAVATLTTLKSTLILEYNVSNLLGVPWEAGWLNSSTYTWTCVRFPNSIAGSPRIVPCSSEAQVAWLTLPNVLNLSRKVVAAAASHNKAVSGSEITSAANSMKISLFTKPTFLSGQGGKVRFVTELKMKSNTIKTFICIQFPRTAYGIPVQVSC